MWATKNMTSEWPYKTGALCSYHNLLLIKFWHSIKHVFPTAISINWSFPLQLTPPPPPHSPLTPLISLAELKKQVLSHALSYCITNQVMFVHISWDEHIISLISLRWYVLIGIDLILTWSSRHECSISLSLTLSFFPSLPLSLNFVSNLSTYYNAYCLKVMI